MCQKSCSVSKETVIRGTVWSEKLALLHAFVFEFRGNNTYIIQDRTASANPSFSLDFLIFPSSASFGVKIVDKSRWISKQSSDRSRRMRKLTKKNDKNWRKPSKMEDSMQLKIKWHKNFSLMSLRAQSFLNYSSSSSSSSSSSAIFRTIPRICTTIFTLFKLWDFLGFYT